MAQLQINISPLAVPTEVHVHLPNGDIAEVPINSLDEETLAELIEEFSTNLLDLASKKS